MIRATVVVPCYNGAALLARCLQSLEDQTLRTELQIVVVDDGSKDDSVAIASGFPVMLVRQANGGPAAARNAGAALAQGPIILFLDADCVAPPHWAAAMIAAFADERTKATVGTIAPSTTGILPTLVQMEIEERYERLRARAYVDFIAAPSCAVRRDYFVEIGGFNSAFQFNEDVELAFRISAAGHGIRLVQDAPVLHAHQTRWRDYMRAKFWRGVWRMRLYRCYPAKLVRDDWTPQTLKLQMMAACLLPPVAIASCLFPRLWPVTALLLVLTVVPGWPVIRAAMAGSTSGFKIVAAGWAVVFLLVRSFTLAAAVIYDRAHMNWSPGAKPATALHKTE